MARIAGAGGGNIFDKKQKTPPGNALLAKEQAALNRQASGGNPSFTLRDVVDAVGKLLNPPPLTVQAGGQTRTVQGGPVFSPVTATLDVLRTAPSQVRAARESAVRIAHPDQNLRERDILAGLAEGAFGVPRGGTREYKPRTIRQNDLEVQVPKPRSRVSQAGLRIADRASQALQRTTHVKDIPGARLLTTGERVAKAAGRLQRAEQVRAVAEQAAHLKAIKRVKPGSPEDVANFWYAQLPATHRNAAGLALIRDKQVADLQYVTSGKALEDLNAQEQALRAKAAALRDEGADPSDVFKVLGEIEDVKVAKTDLPRRAEDTAASVGQLEDLIREPPPVNTEALQAVRALGDERQRILEEAGRLNPERAAERRGLVARFAGLEPTGEEAYIGHRLPRPETSRFPFTPQGGTGRVKSPQGVGSENRLILASQGRLRPSLRVAAEDFQAAQVFRQATQARDDLGKLGVPFTGSVPEGSLLVNPKARTVPAHWKTDELAQFQEGYEDVADIRRKAQEIVETYVADGADQVERMKRDALAQGVDWSDLRVIPKRLVDRYYAQYRAQRARGTGAKVYDSLVDAVAASIVFARVGYVPKNIAQNLILTVPHQGPLLLRNAVYAGQLLSDPAIRPLLRGEIGGGPSAGLAREAFHKKIVGAPARLVTSLADDPLRASAFVHEAVAEGVLPKAKLLLTEEDRRRFLRLLTDKRQRALLNDIHSRSNEAMADFTRMTPDQARVARRFLVIPGWLMAGTRYPFHFALTHPIRSALLAYLALGEPGAPDELHFNSPINEYFTGSGYRQGIQIGDKRLRTNSLSPVSTPYDLAQAVSGTVRGKTGPFDFTTPTIFDETQPLLAAGIRLAQGEGVKQSLLPLAPGGRFVTQEIRGPQASTTYPDDATRLGRLERELGVIPIRVNGPRGKKTGNIFDDSGPSEPTNIFDK